MLWYILSSIPLLLFLWLAINEVLYRFTYSGRNVRILPGPKEKLLIGNLTDLVDNPEGIFNKLRLWGKQFPIYRLTSTVAFPCVNLIKPDDIQHVLSNTNHNDKSDIYLLFKDWLGEGLLTSAGDKWQKRRKILTPTFHFSILKRFLPIFNKHARLFAAEMCQDVGKDIDILPRLHISTLHSVGESAMGNTLTDPAVEKTYRNCIKRMGEIMVHRLLRPWYYFRLTWCCSLLHFEEMKLLKYLKSYTLGIIEQRERNHKDILEENHDEDASIGKKPKRNLAMLDLLISAKQRNEIDTEGIREEVDTFTFEGHDTMSMALSFAFMLVANHPDVQDKLYEEICSVIDTDAAPSFEDLQNLPYMDMVFKESLRIFPSVPLISRVTGDQEIRTSEGVVIPPRTIIIVHIFDTHRLPEYYPDPERFDPERFLPERILTRHPYAYLPFSAGSRNCIGQKYAILAMKCMMVAMLQQFVLLPVDTPESVVLVADVILRSKNGVKIKLAHRHPTKS